MIKLSAETYLSDHTGMPNLQINTPNKWLKLIFYDTGLGIKEQDIKNLFKIFGKLYDP